MKIEMTLEGGAELLRQMEQMPRQMRRGIIPSATKKGLRPTLAAAKSNARSMVGGDMGSKIAGSLEIKPFKRQRIRNTYAAHIMTAKEDTPMFISKTTATFWSKKRKQYEPKEYFIPTAIEYGHARPYEGGYHGAPKHIPPIPFLRSAADQTLESQGLRVFADEVKKGIDKMCAKRGWEPIGEQ